MFTRQLGQCALVACALTLSLPLMGCGKNYIGNFVKSAEVKSYTQESEAWGEVSALLNTGAISLPTLELPVVDPNHHERVLGKISLKDAAGGTRLELSANLTKALHTQGLDGSKLPNGNPIPVSGVSGDNSVAFPIPSGNSRVYLAFGATGGMIGIALVIPQFDLVSQYVGGLDVFLPFSFAPSVRGTAGIFTSTESSKSGIALFVDAGEIMKKPSGSEFSSLMAGDLSHGLARDRATSMSVNLGFKESIPSYKKLLKLQNGINQIGRSNKRVTVQ